MSPIVGIGELLWDIYPNGRKVAGGAPFNFAFHCHQLGHNGVIVSRVGDDDLGHELREEVRRLGLSDEYIQTDHEHPTGTVQVKLDAAGVPTYSITENVAWDHIKWDEGSARLVYYAAAICFGTLVQRNTTSRETVWKLGSNAYGFINSLRSMEMFPWVEIDDMRKRVVVYDVNLRQQFYNRESIVGSLRSATWCKLSEEELAVLVGLLDLDWQTDVTALRSLNRVNNWGKHIVCLTRGAEGSLVLRREEIVDEELDARLEEEICEEPPAPAKVIDTVGAGDAFTAAMVCLHLEGRPLRECARFASHYAASVCEHAGATPRIDRRDVERAAFGK